MWIIFVIACCIILYLSFNLFMLKKEINSITHQIRYLKSKASNQRITKSHTHKYTINLIDEINELMTRHANERRKYRNKEQSIKEEMTHISHDFRTPLTAIKGYVQLLEQESHLGKDERNYFNIINQKIDVLNQQVETFYDLTLIESKDYPVHLSYQPLSKVLDHVLISYYKAFEERSIALQAYHISNDSILIDEALTKRILENLLSNVLKFGKSYVELRTEIHDENLRLIISNDFHHDNKMDINQIFDRTYTSQLNRKDGTGLGLYIVQALTRLQGGSVQAKCENEQFTMMIDFVKL